MADNNRKSNTEKAVGQDPFEDLFGPEWDEITGETTATESTTEADQSTQTSAASDELEPELETTTESELEINQVFEAFAVADEPEAEAEPVTAVEDDDDQFLETSDIEDELEPEFKAIAEINAAEIDQALEALAVVNAPETAIEPVAVLGDEDDQAIEASEMTAEPEVEAEPVAVLKADDDQAIEASEMTTEPEVEAEPVAVIRTEETQATEASETAEELEVEAEPVVTTENKGNQDTESSEAEEAEENLVFEETPGVLDEIIASIDKEIEQSHQADLMAALQTEASGNRNENLEQYIIFTLAGAIYAASAANVREVGEMANLTPVPNVPDWLLGVTNLRGDVLSVVDLHTFLSLEQPDYIEPLSRGDASFSGEQEVLVVHPREDASLITTGLVVDEVNDIRYLTVDRITAPAAPIEDQVGSYLRGIYEDEGHLLVVLDFERLLFSPEMQQFETV